MSSENQGKSVSYYGDILSDLIKDTIVKDPSEILHNKSFTVKIYDQELLDHFNDDPEKFMSQARHFLRDWIRQFKYPVDHTEVRVIIDSGYLILQKMRELRADSYYKPVCFDAVVVGEGTIKTYIKKATFFCPACNNKAVKEVNSTDGILEPFCPKCKEKMGMAEELCEFGEVKDVIIREPFGDSVEKQPIEYACKVRDLLVSRVFVGKKIRIVGLRKAILNRKKNEHPIEVRIFSEEDLGDPKDLMPTEAEIESFTKDSKKPDFEDRLVMSFSPAVYCTKDSLIWNVKSSLLLLALGGNAVEGKRQYINEFLVGDPGTTKSTMMKDIIALSPRSMYISGNGASEAGLTAIIEKQADGKFIAKAGVLPMCDGGGIAGVDEMNLMSEEYQNALQETMENQFITKAKAVNIQMPARCSVLGGANPVFGRYDIDKSVIENTGLAIPLIARFDIKWCIRDEVNQVLDTAIANHVLEYQDNAQKIIDATPYSKTDLIKYLNYAKKIEPELTQDARKAIISFVNRVRALTNSSDSMPIDKRIIESLARLAIARAKRLLKLKVDANDVEYISSLYLKSLESFGINTTSDLKQNVFHDTKELNQESTFWKVFDACKDAESTVDMVEVIAKLAETKHFDEYKAKSFFEKMCIKRLTELRSGRWRKV